jgi:hypothetical protein
MASFSTIPEQQPLLDDDARPKQRKFAATTVAVLRSAETIYFTRLAGRHAVVYRVRAGPLPRVRRCHRHRPGRSPRHDARLVG